MSTFLEKELAIADLRFLLPMQPGDNVFILGEFPLLEKELTQQQVQVTCCDSFKNIDETLPSPLAFHRAIIPYLPSDQFENLIRFLSIHLKAGGRVILGTINPRFGFGLLNGKNKPGLTSLNMKSGSKLWAMYGFKVNQIYGNPKDLEHPRHLVDLARPQISTFYMNSVFVTYRLRAEIFRRFALIWSKIFPVVSLFPTLVWCLERSKEQGAGYVE